MDIIDKLAKFNGKLWEIITVTLLIIVFGVPVWGPPIIIGISLYNGGYVFATIMAFFWIPFVCHLIRDMRN